MLNATRFYAIAGAALLMFGTDAGAATSPAAQAPKVDPALSAVIADPARNPAAVKRDPVRHPAKS